MSFHKLKRKSDYSLYNEHSGEFIPIACHYNNNTLLTKNGELIQTIQINGINAEKISKNLADLRTAVRSSIHDTLECSKYAFWIHTIRRKDDLDDPTPYNNYFSANVHDLWKNKNHWDNKFVNSLYISVIREAPTLKIKGWKSFLKSFSPKIIGDFEESFFKTACEELNYTVDQILSGLEDFGAQRIGITKEDDVCYSDQMFLYRRIMQLNEEECLLTSSDVSAALASHRYAIGSDQIEVIGKKEKKFAALMSIKEYQEVSSDSLDKFLQIPVEMIATEVFYFVNRKEVIEDFTHQNYILQVSKDEELRKGKGIDKIMDDEDDGAKFCHQQISFMIIGDDSEMLKDQIAYSSKVLSEIGIVHVKEDINLEKTFWSQLPGNFSFLSRMKPTILDNTAALASLHNFPTGTPNNPWGRAVTILRTEKGTPYFMDFHDTSDCGTTYIFGEHETGKTTLMNFFLSESEKYSPTILQIVNNPNSALFVKVKKGVWYQRRKNIINPFLISDSEQSKEYLLEFLKIISQHYIKPLLEDELNLLTKLRDKVFEMKPESRSLARLITAIEKLDNDVAKNLVARLKIFSKGGEYEEVFERESQVELASGNITAFDMQAFCSKDYIKKNYPREKKLIPQFEYDLNTLKAVKTALTLSLGHLLHENKQKIKILAIDDIDEIVDLDLYGNILTSFSKNMQEDKNVFFASVNLEYLQTFLKRTGEKPKWIDDMNTSITMAPLTSVKNLDKILGLNEVELVKLSKLKVGQRSFLIKQNNKMLAAEFNISSHPGLARILSSGREEYEIYQDVMKNHSDKSEKEWIPAFYAQLEKA